MFRSNNQDYLPEDLVKIDYKIDHPILNTRPSNSFKYYDLEPMGLGPEGNYFITLDSYIDTSDIDSIRQELEDNIEQAAQHLVHMIPFGLIPEHINGEKCLDSFLLNPEKYKIKKDAYSYAANIENYHALKRYYINRFNLTKSWKRVLHLRKPLPFYQKGNPTEWNSSIQHFPKLKKLIESLPFKHMGIGLIFRSNEDSRLLIHRDSYARNHCMHHINICLSKTTRRVFIYDPINDCRIYLDPNVRSYTFNEIDLHGADPQFDHLVLRIDGQFEDWFCKKLGYEKNHSFDWAYDRPQKFIKEHKKIKIWQSTDI